MLFEVMCECDGEGKDVMEVEGIRLLEEVGVCKG